MLAFTFSVELPVWKNMPIKDAANMGYDSQEGGDLCLDVRWSAMWAIEKDPIHEEFKRILILSTKGCLVLLISKIYCTIY